MLPTSRRVPQNVYNFACFIKCAAVVPNAVAILKSVNTSTLLSRRLDWWVDLAYKGKYSKPHVRFGYRRLRVKRWN